MLGPQQVVLLDKVRRYGFVWSRCCLVDSGSVSPGVDFGISKAQASPIVSLFLLYMDPDVELVAPFLVPTMSAMLLHLVDNGLNL